MKVQFLEPDSCDGRRVPLLASRFCRHQTLARSCVSRDVTPPKAAATRSVLLKRLRQAAEKRAVGVTDAKRRRHYSHAARLVAACATIDPTPETMTWVATVRAACRRYPAMQAEFDRCFGR